MKRSIDRTSKLFGHMVGDLEKQPQQAHGHVYGHSHIGQDRVYEARLWKQGI